jgi:hypothetical protein
MGTHGLGRIAATTGSLPQPPAYNRVAATATRPGRKPQWASVIAAAPTVALVASSIRMRPPVVRFLA